MDLETRSDLWLDARTKQGLRSRMILTNVLAPSQVVIEDEAEENNTRPSMN
jgi:hypothetical protein